MKRSKHSLSFYKLLSMNQGPLTPIGLMEVLPGDSIQQATSAFIRVSPLVAPVMHPVHAEIHHWFVPNRLVWEDWEDFITGGPDGNDASVYPTVSLTTALNPQGGLGDYLGVPPTPADPGTPYTTSVLPFRAYNLIFNEWYRDPDLVDPVDISLASGVDDTTSLSLLNRPWEKDYFTLARPWANKGTEVTIPLGTTVPVVGSGAIRMSPASAPTDERNLEFNTANVMGYSGAGLGAPTTAQWPVDGVTNLVANLAAATGLDPDTIRNAFAIDRYQKARAIYGSRYTEYLRYLGVKSSDARLQRPEYLGGGKQTIQFSEVLQNSATELSPDEPLGTLGGHGIGAMRSNRYRRFFEEHGYVISLLSVKPKTIYAQGIPRTWNRRSKLDYWQKEFEGIGPQAILNKELYFNPSDPAQNDLTFGFIDRHDDYRRIESTIAGEFRNELAYWHMARIFDTTVPHVTPVLNDEFVTSDPTTRIYASSASDQLVVMANHSIQARRLVSSVGRIPHF